LTPQGSEPKDVLDEQSDTVPHPALIPIPRHWGIAGKAVQDVEIRHPDVGIGAGGLTGMGLHHPDEHDGTDQPS
jgi:hypothetical protein